MQIEHDYIRRMIERFGQALAKLLDPKKEEVTYDDFVYRLEMTCYDCTGLDYQLAREMPAEELLKLLRPGESIHPHRYLVIGDLMCLDAAALRQEGREEDAERRHEHALPPARAWRIPASRPTSPASSRPCLQNRKAAPSPATSGAACSNTSRPPDGTSAPSACSLT
ncbi:MAG: hypothetical protein L6R28_25335 [Planctomycetes bacterium]|nr:hypothetical protein [Planctomycetota bacterium]